MKNEKDNKKLIREMKKVSSEIERFNRQSEYDRQRREQERYNAMSPKEKERYEEAINKTIYLLAIIISIIIGIIALAISLVVHIYTVFSTDYQYEKYLDGIIDGGFGSYEYYLDGEYDNVKIRLYNSTSQEKPFRIMATKNEGGKQVVSVVDFSFDDFEKPHRMKSIYGQVNYGDCTVYCNYSSFSYQSSLSYNIIEKNYGTADQTYSLSLAEKETWRLTLIAIQELEKIHTDLTGESMWKADK